MSGKTNAELAIEVAEVKKKAELANQQLQIQKENSAKVEAALLQEKADQEKLLLAEKENSAKVEAELKERQLKQKAEMDAIAEQKKKPWYIKNELFKKQFGMKKIKAGKGKTIPQEIIVDAKYFNLFIGGKKCQFYKDVALTPEEVALFEPFKGIEGVIHGENLKSSYLEQR